MNLKILSPKQALNKAFQKVTVHRKDFDLFKKTLSNLLKNIDLKEGEDNNKSHLKDFLDDTYYKGKHLINVKNKTDLVIYLENKQESKSGVLFEVKRPGNKSEMISKNNLNNKALHELVLYYLDERTNNKNDEIKYLIASNIFEWFIFDAVIFENLFYKNNEFLKEYDNWKNDLKVSSNTDHFYNEIAKPYLDKIKNEISYTHFNLNDFKNLLEKTDKESEKKLIPLYKILSPIHLLKQPFTNDSNSLDKNFYNELLHLIGLVEVKDKNKKIILRKEIANRDTGSIIENAIQILTTDSALEKIPDVSKYGSTKDEQYFNVALELTLTWINRILFLKLLESQLYDYNKSEAYKFLNSKTIKDYDELYKLFHQVLAVKLKDRTGEINNKFNLVPYLNSSLFEITDLENITLKINSLDDGASIDLYSSTVLKENAGRKKTGQLITLHYVFEFLEAYNFTSEGKEEIEDEKKTLINASVLGLIFEKINGYKDGSYFTPGFITMYMSKESIRRAVIQKFNERYNWECDSFDDLHNHLADKRKTTDIISANSVINSLKICDPAVGSGHFLVSCLNEIISVKSELGMLADENGRVLKGYEAHVENDELIISYDEGEEIFEYYTPLKSNTKSETQRVQETLFREKQTIIENCLFGVDINPNSVSIARLRLWIELLKNAYYTVESNYTELETLPNIDINIKEGNSLVSRFELSNVIFTGADRTAFEVYKLNVSQYKNEHDRAKRKQLKVSIDKTKERIKGIAVNPVKELDIKISDLTEKLHNLNKADMFEEQKSKAESEKIDKKKNDLSVKLDKLISERKNKSEEYNILYTNAFEWRFEFPEVLDDDGNYIGFDVVIGNPPYITGRDWGIGFYCYKDYYNEKFVTAEYQLDLYQLFVEKSKLILTEKGIISFIIPNTWLANHKTVNIRKYILEYLQILEIDYSLDRIFEEAEVDVILFFAQRSEFKESNHIIKEIVKQKLFFKHFAKQQDYSLNPGCVFSIFIKKDDSSIIKKIESNSTPLQNYFYINRGVHAYRTDGFGKSKFSTGTQTQRDYDERSYHSTKKLDSTYRKELRGKNIFPYYFVEGKDYLSYGDWLAEPRELKYFTGDRIYLRKIVGVKGLIACLIHKNMSYIADQSVYIAKPKTSKIDLQFILALLNSKLMGFYFRLKNNEFDKLFPQIKVGEFKSLPVRDFKNTLDIKEHVGHLISLKKTNPKFDTSKLESEIDDLVYKLYGLTEEEKKIVEESLR